MQHAITIASHAFNVVIIILLNDERTFDILRIRIIVAGEQSISVLRKTL